jgi:hypothetical protein
MAALHAFVDLAVNELVSILNRHARHSNASRTS